MLPIIKSFEKKPEAEKKKKKKEEKVKNLNW